MIPRRLTSTLTQRIAEVPAVVLLGPRQVGKTTLALNLHPGKPTLYLDLKVYVRDSGILHTLLGLPTYDDILGHPIAGTSWEGFVIETLLTVAPDGTDASFYRTTSGAERRFVVYAGDDHYPLGTGVEAIGLRTLATALLTLSSPSA